MGFSLDDIRREIAKRRLTMRPPDTYEGRIVQPGNPKQIAAVDDDSLNTADLCTRRSGKSSGWLRKMCEDARDLPGLRQVYVNTTRPECRRIAWQSSTGDGLLQLNRKYRLGAAANAQRLDLTFPNEHVIEVVPAKDEGAADKLLGGAYYRVVIDEAQKMGFLSPFIEKVLLPAMMDYGGQLVLIGTPSKYLSGLFYEVTRTDEDNLTEEQRHLREAWSVHYWSVVDNPFFGPTPEARYEKAVAGYLRRSGKKLDDPVVRREWFGEWMSADAHFVYAVNAVPEEELLYAPDRRLDVLVPEDIENFELETWQGPEDPKHALNFPDLEAALADLPAGYEWNHILGIDLGYDPDPFGFTVWTFAWDLPKIFELCSWKMDRLIPDRQRAVLEYVDSVLPISGMVGDAGGQKGVVKGWAEQWQDRYALPIKEAEKARKADFQEFLNNDIRARKMQFRRCSPLFAEMKSLPLREMPNGNLVEDDRRKDGKRIHPRDLCDGALYGYREVRNYLAEEPEPEEPTPGTPEFDEDLARKAREEMIELARRQNAWEEW